LQRLSPRPHETRLVVLFLDAIYLPVRPSGPKEGVMCAWGFTENGDRALVGVRLGAREAKDDWLELGRDLATRGLQAPRLIVADGAPGLTLAIEELWPRADRQHCAVHRLRNLQAKLPKSEHDRVRLAYWKAPNEATGVKDGKLRLQVLISELKHAGYESAARCLTDDLDAVFVHLRYPLRHRNRWRSANLLERSLGEVRRRTKVIGRFPGETSCLTLVWAVSTSSSATPATAPPSPTSTASTSTESNTNGPNRPPTTRRYPPLRLTNGNRNHGEFTAAKGRDRGNPGRHPLCVPGATGAAAGGDARCVACTLVLGGVRAARVAILMTVRWRSVAPGSPR
jgi:transposase-like protein